MAISFQKFSRAGLAERINAALEGERIGRRKENALEGARAGRRMHWKESAGRTHWEEKAPYGAKFSARSVRRGCQLSIPLDFPQMRPPAILHNVQDKTIVSEKAFYVNVQLHHLDLYQWSEIGG